MDNINMEQAKNEARELQGSKKQGFAKKLLSKLNFVSSKKSNDMSIEDRLRNIEGVVQTLGDIVLNKDISEEKITGKTKVKNEIELIERELTELEWHMNRIKNRINESKKL